jgi:hypothetical protein
VARRGRRPLEGVNVYPQRPVGTQHEPLVAEVKVAGSDASRGGGPQDAAGDVQGVVEIIEGGLGVESGPQELHRLLAVEAVLLGQGEQLDQARSLLQAPLLPDASRPHRHPEASKQMYAHHFGPPTSPLHRSWAALPFGGPLLGARHQVVLSSSRQAGLQIDSPKWHKAQARRHAACKEGKPLCSTSAGQLFSKSQELTG